MKNDLSINEININKIINKIIIIITNTGKNKKINKSVNV